MDACRNAEIPADVVAVISNEPDAYGLQRAASADIPAHVLNHREFESREAYDISLRELVAGTEPDLVVLAGFMRILTGNFLDGLENRIMNIHPSLLPLYTGLNTHQRALDAGDAEHGCTVHFVTAELDAGPRIIQGQVPVLPEDDADSLQQRVHKAEHIIYPRAVQWYAEQRLEVRDGEVFVNEAPGPGLVICDRDGREIKD